MDREETKLFVNDALGNLGGSMDFSTEAFNDIFETFDQDKNGTIERNEMMQFLKQFLGL